MLANKKNLHYFVLAVELFRDNASFEIDVLIFARTARCGLLRLLLRVSGTTFLPRSVRKAWP